MANHNRVTADGHNRVAADAHNRVTAETIPSLTPVAGYGLSLGTANRQADADVAARSIDADIANRSVN